MPRQGNSLKSGISFENFRSVMETIDPEISSLDVASYYRQAWVAGSGAVSFESFFLIANDSIFFLKTLRLLGFNATPVLNQF